MSETAESSPAVEHDERHRRYPAVAAQPDYPAMEEEVLSYWATDQTFEASVEKNPPSSEFVFYDGPPFASGLPHYGHLLTGFVKDAVPRYQTMRGRRVERVFGWDCHGLPAEMPVERELGLAGRAEVMSYGVERFNEHCRSFVQRSTDGWERYVTRQARWVDFANGYQTMDLSYTESVLWAFKQLYEKGLTYEGYRVLPYCWECETPLSNMETRLDDSYRDRTDLAVTVLFELVPAGDGPLEGPVSLAVWTTTPWTLPSNLAIAVGPEIDYSLVALERAGERELVALASERLAAYASELGDEPEVVASFKGAELVGRSYKPLFDYFSSAESAFVVLGGEFVSTDEGTGIVHMAPGFGEDDQFACEAAGIKVVAPVDDRGRFTEEVADYTGVQVFETNEPIARRLDAAGSLLRREEYLHSYPHCWRTDTPLIYRAVSSFFVKVTAIRDRMVELNQQIDWMPEHIRDGAFGKWLEGARDWSISRNRFWGAPIPVWKSDDPAYPRVDVYGSLDELEQDFGVRPDNLHRPFIDELTRPNPDDPTGRSTMRRVSDIFDCWFESGSMPYAQWHYPFENRERFEAHFPADFIVEYVSQTRGWFYTLHVLATALFDKPPFKSCIVHGVILGRDGRKFSKRLQNFPDPEQVFATVGADPMRWYLLSSPVLRGLDVEVDEAALKEPVRLVLNPIWNSWYFLSLYSNADGLRGRYRTDQEGELDRYVLAKARQLVEAVTAAMEGNDIAGATFAISGFLDVLTNWYVRRSRDRFWRAGGSAEDGDKLDAYDTLHTVLDVLMRVAAPFLPYLTESVYRSLTGARSVHLQSWPDPAELPRDDALVTAMDLVREVASVGHSIRKQTGRRARLPLRRLTVATPQASSLEAFSAILSDELNVKEVVLTAEVGAELAEQSLSLVPATLGPRLGAATQKVIAAVRAGDYTIGLDGRVVAGGVELEKGEFSVELRPADESSSRLLTGSRGIVTLEVETDDELEAEGVARDVVRLVQKARRDAGLEVSDRIVLTLASDRSVLEALDSWRKYLTEQVLASSLELRELDEGAAGEKLPGGASLAITLKRA